MDDLPEHQHQEQEKRALALLFARFCGVGGLINALRELRAPTSKQVVLELLSGDQTLAQVATKHEVTPISLKAWKKQFLENASMAFDVGKATQSFKEEIATLKNENDARLAFRKALRGPAAF